MLIYIVGYMGCGKSTIGRQLSKRLKYSFQDSDALIEHKYKVDISQIFEKYGEGVFRVVEQKVLKETLSLTAAVIATGGGLPCYKDNMDIINEHGVSVYIKLHPVHLCERLRKSRQKRPLLKGINKKELLAFIEQQLEKREEFYNKAKIIFDPYSDNIESLANKITSI